jgi:hypothetical protein
MESREALSRLADLQRSLEERTASLDGSPAAVLALGPAVLDFAASEEHAFLPLLGLLDPAVRAELAGEHESLAQDLELLGWLVDSTPESTDAAVLAEALTRRIRQHIARDGRLLAQAQRLDRAARDPRK